MQTTDLFGDSLLLVNACSVVNYEAGAMRIPDDGFMLLASSPCVDIGADRARAELKARFLSQFAVVVIRTEFPALASKMFRHTAVLNWGSINMEMPAGE